MIEVSKAWGYSAVLMDYINETDDSTLKGISALQLNELGIFI